MNENIKSHYSYPDVINWLENKGIELYGNYFKIFKIYHLMISRYILPLNKKGKKATKK